MSDTRKTAASTTGSEVRSAQRRPWWSRACDFLLGLFLLGTIGPTPLWSADILVTTNADSGAGSLRDAIEVAAPGDRIIFSASLAGGDTITLGSMLPLIDKDLEIDGSANPNLVIDGSGSHRAFFVRSGTVSLSSVTTADWTRPVLARDMNSLPLRLPA